MSVPTRDELDGLGARVAWLEERVAECELCGADARLLQRALSAARGELAAAVWAAVAPEPPRPSVVPWLVSWLRKLGVRCVVLVLR